MSEEVSPESDKSEKMDISESSAVSDLNTEPVLRFSLPTTTSIQTTTNLEVLDNIKQYEKVNKVSQNATDSHPLMFSPGSPMSPDFPDLIPEKPKNRHTFKPLANSSHVESSYESYAYSHSHDLPKLEDLKKSLPEYSQSPSMSKKQKYQSPQLDIADLSDNENDKSVYEAHLSSNFQNVAMTMNEKEGNLNFLAYGKKSNKLRKIRVVTTEEQVDSDISSLDSSPDSLKSEDVFAGMADVDDFETERSTSRNETPEPIEPLSADDERRHARYWQRMVLPGGEQRTIDMRVIEPYKRVLSHGGYLRAGGHTAIVLFSACFLPDKSRCDYDYVMDNLFLYVLWTLERLVTEDYVLVYMHGGATRLPSFRWLKRCYQMVGRKLRKNLCHLYLVHPTLWIKTMLFMAKPFISSKFYRKISFIQSLKVLRGRVPIELAAVPEKVKAFDSLHYGT